LLTDGIGARGWRPRASTESQYHRSVILTDGKSA
jgi:hypothetical protein